MDALAAVGLVDRRVWRRPGRGAVEFGNEAIRRGRLLYLNISLLIGAGDA